MDEEKKSEFISETIVNDAIKEHQRKNLFGSALGGALFGLAALAVFGCGIAIWHHASANDKSAETETAVETESDLPANEAELEAFVTDLIQADSKTSKGSDLSAKLASAMSRLEETYVTIVAENSDVGIFSDEFSTSENYSGMVIRKNENGYFIVTSAGKFKNADKILVRLYDGATVNAEYVKQDSALNIAVLKISLSDGKIHGLDTCRVGKLSKLNKGDAVFWYGNASGSSASLGVGYISCFDEGIKLPDVSLTGIQVSESCNAEKGSFLVGTDGSIYGMALGASKLPEDYSLTEGYGVALSAEEMLHYINKMILGKKIASVGLIGQDVTESMQSDYNMPEGMYITQVTEDSAAYDAGIQEGDVITSIGGNDIAGRKDYTDAVLTLTAGKKIKAVIYRENKGEYRKMTVKLKTGKR